MKFQKKKTQLLIIFENLNAYNFLSELDRKKKFTALKRAKFFPPITLIQLMSRENTFLNNLEKNDKN